MRRPPGVLAMGLIAIIAVVATARPAIARDPTAEDLATARALFNDSVELRAQGDLPGALERLKAAYALVPTPIIGLELGRALLETGKLVEARETCYAASRLPVSAEESSAGAAARRDAAQLAEQLRPRIPAIRVDVAGAPPDETVHVTVDGESVPAQVLRFPFKVNPGTHHIQARAGSSQAPPLDVAVAEGEERSVTLTLAPAPAESPPAQPPESPLPNEPPAFAPPVRPAVSKKDHDGRGLQRGIGIGIAGLGLASLAAGLALAGAAKSRYDSATPHCPTNTTCDTMGLSLTHDALTFATGSTVAIIGAGAFLAAGGVVFFTALRPRSATALRAYPTLGAGFAGASLLQPW